MWQHVKLCRSVPEIHSHAVGTLSNQQKQNKKTNKNLKFLIEYCLGDLLNGKASTSAGDLGLPLLAFLWLSHTSDLNSGTLVVTLAGALCCKVNTRTDLLGVSIL